MEFQVDLLSVARHANRQSMGAYSADLAARWMKELIDRNAEVNVIFACAPSQDEFFDALVTDASKDHGVDWSCVRVFHMDEYIGLTADHPQSFRSYLLQHLLSRVEDVSFFAIEGERSAQEVISDYSRLLREHPVDITCMGIGENGHIAFNDPPVADFFDVESIKVVELDAACRQQQVNDGCFATIEDVPTHALTLTIPELLRSKRIVCTVPGRRKAGAVKAALEEPISTETPASILRAHPHAFLSLDAEAGSTLTAGLDGGPS